MHSNLTEGEAKARGRVLIVVSVEGADRVVIGGWDNHWTGQCWVYENERVPARTKPIAFQSLPRASTIKGEEHGHSSRLTSP